MAQMSISKKSHSEMLRARGRDVLKGFDCNDLQYQLLKDNYELTYASFEKHQVASAKAHPASLSGLIYELLHLEGECTTESCDGGDDVKPLSTPESAQPNPVPALPIEHQSAPRGV